jgi:hypothetical protein
MEKQQRSAPETSKHREAAPSSSSGHRAARTRPESFVEGGSVTPNTKKTVAPSPTTPAAPSMAPVVQ